MYEITGDTKYESANTGFNKQSLPNIKLANVKYLFRVIRKPNAIWWSIGGYAKLKH